MALKYIQAGTATDIHQVTNNLTQNVNQLVTQINAASGKLQGTLNAQGNAINNLPAPTSPGDPVTLGYLQQALGSATSSINDTLNRAQSGYRNRPKPYHCIFKAAVAQNGTALMGMNWSSPVTGDVISIGDLYFAGMHFDDTHSPPSVQDHFPLPEDWVPSSLDCIVSWYAPDAGGDAVTWSVAFAHATNLADGAQVFNADAGVAASAPAGPKFVISTISNVLVTSNVTNTDFQPGDEVFFRLTPSGLSGTAVLIDLKFLVRRQSG